MDKGTNAMSDPNNAAPGVDLGREAAARINTRSPADHPDRGARSPEAIQREIEQTRAELGETVSAIQERLAPDQLVQQTKEITMNAVREGVPKMMNGIRNNPGPSLLIAAGVGWFIYNANRSRRQAATYPDVYYTAPSEYDLTEGGAPEGFAHGQEGGTMQRVKEKIKDTAGTIKDKASQLAGQAKEKSSHLTDRVKDKTEEWSETGSEKTGQFKNQVKEYTAQAKDYMSHFGHTTKDAAKRTNDRIWQMVQENPLAVGAAALAIGAAIGLMLPESEKENKMMGDSRDHLLDRAKATGEDMLERTKKVAEEATVAAKDEAREQGFISE